MKALHPWRGVRLRTLETGSDPDGTPHRVSVPADWSEAAARGFVGLCCDETPSGWDAVRLPDAAEAWIDRLAAAGRETGVLADATEFAETLHCMLLLRQGCPDRGVWRGEAGSQGFVLNLASFADPETGFDSPCLLSAVKAAGSAAMIATAGGPGSVRVADVDGMLARLGFDYDSEAGRHAARDVVRQLRLALDGTGVGLETGRADCAEALLGVETAGYAPAFSPVGADGCLTLASQARLAGLRLSPERALAMALDGSPPLRAAGAGAHQAMHDVLAPLLDACPGRPSTPPRLVASAAPVRRALPARSKGFTQKVTVGGQRVFLRTAEYAEGSLGEVSIMLSGRDQATARGMADAFSTVLSLGLQHGIPLNVFVDAFAHGRFGASGLVEGDPAILSASSPLDYAVRALAEIYLARHIEDPPAETGDDAPLLPLGLTGEATSAPVAGGLRQRALRLVCPA